MAKSLPAFATERRTGGEQFSLGGEPARSTLLDFWQWASSDLLGNTERGILAEYIVALALGVTSGVRAGWLPYDLDTADGLKVEVKSSAYVQTWLQQRPSRISFGIRPTYAWDPVTDTFEEERRRQADVYVFCVLTTKDQTTIDPLDLDQWEFHVVPTSELDERVGSQKTISLPSLENMGFQPVGFAGLADAVAVAGTG